MNRNRNMSTLTAIAAAIGLAFSAATMAGNQSKDEFRAAHRKIDADYRVAREKCDHLAGDAKDVCVKEALAVHSARADARPEPKTGDGRKEAVSNQREIERAEALEKCNAMAGDARRACVIAAEKRYAES